MIADLPGSVYKYFGPDRVNVISDKLLRYTQLGDFNDPFEGRPEITGLSTRDEALTIFDNLIPEEIKAVYEALPADMKRAVSYQHVHSIAKARLQSKREEILGAVATFTPLVAGFIHQKLDELLGVLCLSEVPDSLLMWAHYAASHSGFVLEFKSKHPYFHQQVTQEDELRRLRRVFYRETRPSDSLTSMDSTELFLVKSGHWAYEREWRIIRQLSDSNEVALRKPYPIHLFSFPPQAINSVIIGSRATQETVEKIKAALSADIEYAHVHIRRAVPDTTHFHLRILDDPS